MPPTSINANRRVQQVPPPPVSAAAQAERLARVTKSSPAPSAGAAPGMPLPAGKIVGFLGPDDLTDEERAAMGSIGWTTDVPLPKDPEALKKIRAAAEKLANEPIPLPVDPRTPPLVVETIDIKDATQEQKAKFSQVVSEATLEAEARRRREVAEARKPAVEGLAAAQQLASQAAESMFRDTPTAPQPPENQTGAAAGLSHCPNCNHDLSQSVDVEPSDQDKTAFLHTVLGGRPFVKEYTLMGGNLRLTFRGLTVKELEEVYKQASKDVKDGKISATVDHYEQLNRYRFCLQLSSVETVQPPSLRDLPDGFSKETNKNATAFWEDSDLPTIENWLSENVLMSESLYRMAHVACANFNRLATKMEAMVDNSDFWKLTGPPS